ncbi:MAG TPA: peptidase S8, partial [Bacteroidetes bacterium]|nr:peptidase S8 [Bacteroidota bacterium]
VYDLLGRDVTTLVNESQQPGTYTVTWDARDVTSGVYYYTLVSGGYREIKKLLLLR